MKKIFFLTLAIPGFAFSQTDTTAKKNLQPLILKEGTEISISLLNDISGKTAKVGEHIDFTTSEDIILNDSIVVPKGAKVSGTVTDAEGSKMFGKKGKLEFTADYLYLQNNKIAKLRSSIDANTHGRGALVAAGAVFLTPIALFIKGKQATYSKGTVFKVYIDQDIALN